MIFAQLNEGACRTYLIASQRTRSAMIVDPVLAHVDRYLDELDRRGLSLAHVVDTHVHADHVSGGAAVRDRTGADYVMEARSPVAFANVRVTEGDVLRVGDIPVRVLHTPGHSEESISLLAGGHLLTGDFLLAGADGTAPARGAPGDPAAHWEALRKLASLPARLRLCPAHEYRAHESLSLGEARRTNARLRARSKAAYAELVGTLADFEIEGAAARINRLDIPTVSAEILSDAVASHAPLLLLDVREPDEWAGELGYIPGARLLRLGDLERRLPGLDGLQAAVIVAVCRTGGRAALAAAILREAGFADARALEGGMRRWRQLRLPVARAA